MHITNPKDFLSMIDKVANTLKKQEKIIGRQGKTIIRQGQIICQLNNAIELAKKTRHDDTETISILREKCFEYKKQILNIRNIIDQS